MFSKVGSGSGQKSSGSATLYTRHKQIRVRQLSLEIIEMTKAYLKIHIFEQKISYI
jgi:hypothetical protein